MTASEVIELALTRTINAGNIKQSDIDLSYDSYVVKYLSGTIDPSDTFYTNYVKPVIAHGVIVDIWDRIAIEVTDRGQQLLTAQGVQQNETARVEALKSYSIKLNKLINLMLDNVPTGVTVIGETWGEVMTAETELTL